MARIIIHKEKGPKDVKIGDKVVTICRCGLSKNQPFCDDSHLKTKDEEDGKLYKYVGPDRERKEVKDGDDVSDAYRM